MIVKIKHKVKEQKWSGYKGPLYKGCKHSLTAYYNSGGNLITGLSPEDEKRLGEILDEDLRNTSEFWYDFRVVITDKDLVLDTKNPLDELKYLLLKSHYLVAKSESDLNPRALYTIYDEEKEAEVANQEASTKIKAYTLLSKLTMNQKREVLKLYPGFTKTDNVTDAIIDARIFEQMERNPARFVKIVEDKKRDMKIFLKDLVTHRILRKNKNAYYYGDDALGHDEESTITHLDDPANQSLKVVLMQELKEKSK